MIRTTLLIIFCCSFSLLGLAQGKITGQIKDTKGQNVGFATIILQDKTSQKVVQGNTTNEEGKFTLENVPNGFYKLTARFVGYTDKIVDSLTISDTQKEIALSNITLKDDSEIKGIEVVGQKDLLEELPDRIVYNAEKDLTNAGGTAADVLRKAPMVSVDLDNNVQIRGNSNVKILVNGKPSAMMANNVGEALRQFPADMIKKVEVITNPSAKYEAEGTAGIINIITKKKTLEGVNGSIFSAAGTRNSNLFTNLNIKRKKIGTSLSFGGGAWYAPFRSETNRDNLLPNLSFLNQDNDGNNLGFWGNGNWNTEFDLSNKHAFSTNVRFSRGGYMSNSILSTNFADENLNPLQQFARDTDQTYNNGNTDITADYTRIFKDSRKDWSVIAQYSRGINNNRYELLQNPANSTIVDYQERNRNEAINQEWSFQTDFTQPLDSSKTLELGARATLRNVNSDFHLDLFDFNENNYINQPNLSNIFEYQQNVMAGYTVFSWNTKKKLGIKAGLRYEMTDINGDFKSSDTTINQSYDNLIPSLAISKSFDKIGQFKISYSRRIQRPFIFYLNPYVNFVDNKNISFGNPNLRPELTNNFELGYSIFKKNTSFNTTLYWRNTNDVISSIRSVDANGISSTTFDNFATNNSYGVSVFGGFQFLKNGRINSNLNVYYVNLNNQNEGWMYNGNVNISYKFNKNFSLQSFSIINSPRVELQGTSGTWFYYNLGLRRALFKEKGGITLGLDNPFANAMVIRSKFNTDSFQSNSTVYQYNRGIRVSFNYNFGKIQNEQRKPRKKKTLNNDDIKQGEDGNGGQK